MGCFPFDPCYGSSTPSYQIPVLSDFRTMFPELTVSKYSDNLVNFWFTQSTPIFNLDRWGDLLFMGMLYWVAHSLTVAAANAVQQTFDDAITKKVGDIMKQRSDTLMQKQADEPYYRTTYGQQYLYYKSLVGAGGLSV